MRIRLCAPRGFFRVSIGASRSLRLSRRPVAFVEVDVRVLATLFLVVLDPYVLTLEAFRLLSDRFAERRVLVAVGVAHHVAHVSSPRLEGPHIGDCGQRLHVRSLPVVALGHHSFSICNALARRWARWRRLPPSARSSSTRKRYGEDSGAQCAGRMAVRANCLWSAGWRRQR